MMDIKISQKCAMLTISLKMLTVFMTVGVVGAKISDKYSRDANSMIDGDRPFKMNKVNIFWKQANEKVSDEEERADLFADLKLQDAYEAAVKEGYSKEKKKMAEESYQSLVKKWIPEDEMQDIEGNSQYSHFTDDDKELIRDLKFDDPKLQVLWNQVLNQNIPDEQILELKEDFESQEMIIKEFQEMKKDLIGIDASAMELNEIDLDMEDVHKYEQAEDVKDHEEMLIELKLKIKEGFNQLRDTLANLQSDSQTHPWFYDPRAQALWDRAQKASWSKGRMEEFMNELHDFDKKVNKHRNYKKELEALKYQVQDGEKGAKERQEWLIERAGHIKKRVFQLLDDLERQVQLALNHSEL